MQKRVSCIDRYTPNFVIYHGESIVPEQSELSNCEQLQISALAIQAAVDLVTDAAVETEAEAEAEEEK